MTARGRWDKLVFGSIRFFARNFLGARKPLGLLASMAVVPAHADHGRHEEK